MVKLGEFVDRHSSELQLELLSDEKGLERDIDVGDAHRPGLGLGGLSTGPKSRRVIVLGREELDYLGSLDVKEQVKRLGVVAEGAPAVFLSRRFQPPEALVEVCSQKDIPLLRSPLRTTTLLAKLTLKLSEEFAPTVTRHGTLVEVFGVGLFIQGDSAVGKSEAALGLIERGHRLIADDIVKVRKREPEYLEGFGIELTRHHMEIRGIGLLNVASLYGAICVRDRKRIDLVVHLEEWDDDHFYDRVGLEDKHCDILDVAVPYHVLPVKPGRDVVLLLETIALRHRLMKMGINTAKELNARLIATMSRGGR